jgi:VWFA-related protein
MAIAFTALSGGVAPAQDRPQPARLVEIDAVVVDRDGHPVTDLKPEDLEVWIGGLRVPIESLTPITAASSDEGRLIVLLLDDITLDPAAMTRARRVATRFVSRMLPGDRMAVVTLNGGAMELSDDPARLRARIEAVRQSVGGMPVDRIGEHLLGAVDSVARSVSEAPGTRKTIVAIGSTWLLDTPVPPAQMGRDLRREWTAALRSLAVANAVYYVIDPHGVGGSRQVSGEGLAREAGGHAFTNTNDLDGAADRILREAGTYYLIRVGDPPVGRNSELRELDVRAKRQGLTIRARRAIPGGRGPAGPAGPE